MSLRSEPKERGMMALRLGEARFLVQRQPQLCFSSTAQHSTSTAQHATAASVLDFHQQLEVRSAKCSMCSVVGSALPLLRQNPSDQHPAPSSNLALASPGTVEMNKSNLKRNMPSRLLHSATVTILGRHVQTKVTSCRAVDVRNRG
jgi:hypothetical protein